MRSRFATKSASTGESSGARSVAMLIWASSWVGIGVSTGFGQCMGTLQPRCKMPPNEIVYAGCCRSTAEVHESLHSGSTEPAVLAAAPSGSVAAAQSPVSDESLWHALMHAGHCCGHVPFALCTPPVFLVSQYASASPPDARADGESRAAARPLRPPIET
jgi:hypothetical protein